MSNEWIKWEGGECPVDHDLEVVVRLRDGRELTSEAGEANGFVWSHGSKLYGYEIIAYRPNYPEFLVNPMKDDGLTDHELDEPGDGIPEELAIKDIPPLLRPETETTSPESDSMDDLERLARELHNAPKGSDTGWVFEGNMFFGCGMQTGYNMQDIQVKRDELSGRPKEWVNDWARWRAQDAFGWWCEYEKSPSLDGSQDDWSYGALNYQQISKGEVLGDWRDTLDERVVEICLACAKELGDDKFCGDCWGSGYPDAAANDPIGEDKAVEWDGTGFPPDDLKVMIRHMINGELSSWHRGKIVAFKGNKIWYQYGQTDFVKFSGDVEFRPIKSDKEKAIEEMLALDPYDPCSAPLTSRSQLCEILYDAGYKK